MHCTVMTEMPILFSWEAFLHSTDLPTIPMNGILEESYVRFGQDKTRTFAIHP